MIGRRVFAVILAAGQSRRMGQPKQMLPYGDGTILDAVIEAVLESSADGLVVVANPQTAGHLAGCLPELCTVAVNRDAGSGMIASARIGRRRVETEFAPGRHDGVMVLLADQPEVTGGTITTLVEAYRQPRRPPGILIAVYGGRRGHPTIFAFDLLAEIEGWADDLGLNELARRHGDAVRELPITTCPMPIDVNTPEDYERLL